MSEYQRSESAIFRATKERWGSLSNMAAGYPISVNQHLFLTTEALYQSMRFSHDDARCVQVQQEIMEQKSPMAAKMVSKKHVGLTREDWDQVRVPIMDWCLRIKLNLHWDRFSAVLSDTGDLSIVEESHKDRFWGAVPLRGNPEILEGENMLGKLLMRLRENVMNGKRPNLMNLPVEKLLLLGNAPTTFTPGSTPHTLWNE